MNELQYCTMYNHGHSYLKYFTGFVLVLKNGPLIKRKCCWCRNFFWSSSLVAREIHLKGE